MLSVCLLGTGRVMGMAWVFEALYTERKAVNVRGSSFILPLTAPASFAAVMESAKMTLLRHHGNQSRKGTLADLTGSAINAYIQ